MGFLSNYPLWSAIIAILFAQFIKVPIQLIATRKLNWSLMTSTGGMPSSHSAGVTALTTAIGITQGFHSPIFAVSTVFAIIVMFDATGVRRQAGEQAIVLNQLAAAFYKFVEDAKDLQNRKELKELLGHKPLEVLFGIITGILVSVVIYYIVY
ncbi:divergent PAP2 family protein [Heyndrickxia acidicola]|uniref:Divergent PAP2 family protein n=1 Tax=Heyndrickxia acidicola TaxID=209389 RepID=A0ABU6MN26_9BACI|nr:divergent PAP2 family protein [Heyndrickxia acidicola]MED1205914.1 divergent PAP2 family protein [Heyndrickxia acidicola]